MSSESKVVGFKVPIQFSIEMSVAPDGTLSEVMSLWVDSNRGPGQKVYYPYTVTNNSDGDRMERATAMSICLSHPQVVKALGLEGLL